MLMEYSISQPHSATAATIAVLLGNGNGSFQPAVGYTTAAARPLGVAAADMNSDGVLQSCGRVKTR